MPSVTSPSLFEESPKCPYCAIRDVKQASQSQASGLYALACLQCAAALVRSARPSRLHQEAMLAAIARVRNAPSRERVLAELGKERERETQPTLI